MIEFEFNTESNGMIHFEKHDVTVKEIDEFFNEIEYLERKRKDKSFVGCGKLKGGRFLEVIFRKKTKSIYFVITAYDIDDNRMIQVLDKELS